MRAKLLTLAALAAVAAPVAGAEDFRWHGKVTGTLEVKGVNGGIDAGPAPGGEAEVVATKRGRRSDPAEVKIEVVEHAGGVTLCAVYPGSEAASECKPGAGGRMSVRDNDVQVEFAVKVPAGVRFVGRTVNGGIEARDLPGDAEVHTVNGGVEVGAAGHVMAETVNGGILAEMGRADWKGPLEFKTVNGGIKVALPPDAGAEVRAATVNGDISTDFPLAVQGRFSKRNLEGTIGAGGRQLALETVNGSIEITKKP